MALDEAGRAASQAGLALVQSGLAKSVGKTLGDGVAFIEQFFGGDPRLGKTKDDLKKDLSTLGDRGKRLNEKFVGPLKDAKSHLDKMLTAVTRTDFGGPADAANELAACLAAIDKAIKGLAAVAAEKASGPPQNPDRDEAIEAAIAGVATPIVQPIGDALKDAQAAATGALDGFCKTVLGIDAASAKLGDKLAWDAKTLRLSTRIDGPTASVAWKLLTLEKTTVELFVEANYVGPSKPGQPPNGPTARAAIRLKGDMSAGLRGDDIMKGIIPGEAATSDKTSVAVTLATNNGLTFGDGEDERIGLPLRAMLPSVELREFALSKPASGNADGASRLDVTGVVAAKLGGVLAVVAQGYGVTAHSGGGQPAGNDPRVPDGLGFRLTAGPVKGGGYLQHRETEGDYGGVVQLAVGPVDATAMALFTAKPEFSFVTVIGVRFAPKIELSFGFTLNGVGGIVAYNRTLSVDKLAASLKDAVVSDLLFPADPVPVAPKLLGKLSGLFPVQPGSFVFGPIVELGWGSQTGIVKAKVGVVVAPPDPHVTVLGSATVQVPPDVPGAPPLPKYVDLKLDMMAVIGPDQLYLRAALAQSKLAGIPVSGDLGVFIRWAGSGGFALSAGGFYPGYPAPAELADLRRLAIGIKSPVKAVKLSATGYFALTANSVQIGGQVDLDAKVGPVHGTGYLGLDALFQWSPSLHFALDVRAGIKLSAYDQDIAGVEFKGHLEGTAPWKLSGNAKVEVLFWDIEFPLGPYEWGDPAVVAPSVSALDAVVDALGQDAAWSARTGKTGLYQLHPAPGAPDTMIAGNSTVVAKQMRVPLEVPIDRIGPAKSKEHRLHLEQPVIGAGAAAVGPVKAQFAMSQFQDLSDDEQLTRPAFETLTAGVELAASTGFSKPGQREVAILWETKFPGVPGGKVGKAPWLLSGTTIGLGGVAAALARETPAGKARRGRNPYATAVTAPVAVREGTLRQLAAVDRVTTLSPPLAAAESGRALADAGGAAAGVQIVTAGVFA